MQYNTGTAANPATATFDARFYFDPHGNTGTNQDIFVARTTGGCTVFRVRYSWNGGAADNDDLIYAYSSRGPSACGDAQTFYPELVAPGWNRRCWQLTRT